MRRANQEVGRKRENPEKKTPDTSASRTWLVSHVASAALEPTPKEYSGLRVIFSIEGRKLYPPPPPHTHTHQMEKGLSSNSIALESVFQKIPTRHCGLA